MSRLSVDTKTIHIRGMFCVHCEETIRKALLALPCVKSADVSWEKEIAVVTGDPSLWDDGLIRKTIEDAGYEVISSGESRIQIASILVILLALWVIANHLGWTQIFNLFPRIETSLSIGALFLTGLLTSVHCLAMCGGINLTQSVMASSRKQKILRSNVLYHTGRVISYTLIGAIAGGIGSVLTLGGIFKGFAAITAGTAMLIMALNMLGVFRFLRKLRPKFSGKTHASLFARIKSGSSFLIGLLNGLMPCGPLQAMQLYALSTGSILQGAFSMLAFSLGTVPLMFGFGLISSKLNWKYSRVMLTVSAMLIFIMGLNMLGNGLALSGVSLPQRNASAVIQAMQDEGVQTLRTEIDYGSYPAVRVKAGIPVDWTIIVPEGKLNGCNGEILIPAYQIDVVLQEGENAISFLPEQPGTISYSCWMGMIRSTIEITE